jgi:hypothetical protein
MTGFAIIAALISFYVSDMFYKSVVARAKPLFPSNLQDERAASFSLGAYIWQPAFPAELRRKYLLSIGFGALAAFWVALIAYNTGHSLWAAFFACLLSYVAWHGVLAWSKHRARL